MYNIKFSKILLREKRDSIQDYVFLFYFIYFVSKCKKHVCFTVARVYLRKICIRRIFDDFANLALIHTVQLDLSVVVGQYNNVSS